MIALTLAEVVDATHGRLEASGTEATGATVVDGSVTTDSREVVPGGVFVAKRGEFDDGHRFAPGAREMSCTPHWSGVAIEYGLPGFVPNGRVMWMRTHESAAASAAKIMM